MIDRIAFRACYRLCIFGVTHDEVSQLTKGLEANLSWLAQCVTERVSDSAQAAVVDIIERARTLKNRRNQSVHGVWVEMEDAETGQFRSIMRSRYEKHRAVGALPGRIELDVTTPTLPELRKLAADLLGIARQLNEDLANLWDLDTDLMRWREEQGFA